MTMAVTTVADLKRIGPAPGSADGHGVDPVPAIRDMLDDQALSWALWPHGRPGARTRAPGLTPSAAPA